MLEVGNKHREGTRLTQHHPPPAAPGLAPHAWDPQKISVTQGRHVQGGCKSHSVPWEVSNRVWYTNLGQVGCQT